MKSSSELSLSRSYMHSGCQAFLGSLAFFQSRNNSVKDASGRYLSQNNPWRSLPTRAFQIRNRILNYTANLSISQNRFRMNMLTTNGDTGINDIMSLLYDSNKTPLKATKALLHYLVKATTTTRIIPIPLSIIEINQSYDK